MTSWAGRTGALVIAWSQTDVDGRAGAAPGDIDVGAFWRWRGRAVELDPADTFLPEGAFASADAHRRHTVATAGRVVGRATGGCPTPDPGRAFTVTDGRESWVVSLIDLPSGQPPLLVFAGAFPPAGRPLRVIWSGLARDEAFAGRPGGVVCFTPGTLIDTPKGALPVEGLVAGDFVTTPDAGRQEIVWIGARRLSPAVLARDPDLVPVRLGRGALGNASASGDLVVSPDHGMLVRGRHSDAEVIVAARDLADGGQIRRDHRGGPVTYVHLMLERHHLIVANGFLTESFHPGAARLDDVPEADRLRLFDIMPGLEDAPALYGRTARPVISGAEAALFDAA